MTPQPFLLGGPDVRCRLPGPRTRRISLPHKGSDLAGDGGHPAGVWPARFRIAHSVVAAVANHAKGEVQSFGIVGIVRVGVGVVENLRSEIFVGAAERKQSLVFLLCTGAHLWTEECSGRRCNGTRRMSGCNVPIGAPPVIGKALHKVV